MADRSHSDTSRPTLLALARAAGVSRTTASNAFNRPDQLSTEVRERILKTARTLGYAGPNPVARMLRTGKAGAIGLVTGDSLPYLFSDPTAIALLKGLGGACQKHESSILLLPDYDQASTATLGHAVVDGFVLYCLPDDSPLVPAARERGLPTVTVDMRVAGVPSVEIDDRVAARSAAEYLLGLGHTRFAILTMELLGDGYHGPVTEDRLRRATFANGKARVLGYRDALAAAGLEPQATPVVECPGNSATIAASATEALLDAPEPPRAILAATDQFAFGVLRAARARGLAVPDALAVVGFDDTPGAAEVTPALTTLRQPLEEKGERAAGMLFDPPQDAPRLVLPTELVVRASTGPPSG